MTESVTAEVSQYKSMPVLALSKNPLQWWREQASFYPKLSCMARKHLAIVAPSERLFSIAGMIVNVIP